MHMCTLPQISFFLRQVTNTVRFSSSRSLSGVCLNESVVIVKTTVAMIVGDIFLSQSCVQRDRRGVLRQYDMRYTYVFLVRMICITLSTSQSRISIVLALNISFIIL